MQHILEEKQRKAKEEAEMLEKAKKAKREAIEKEKLLKTVKALKELDKKKHNRSSESSSSSSSSSSSDSRRLVFEFFSYIVHTNFLFSVNHVSAFRNRQIRKEEPLVVRALIHDHGVHYRRKEDVNSLHCRYTVFNKTMKTM